MTMFRKEIRENWQNKKWLWVPVVMIFLTIMDPLSYYYLPEIIELTGGVPEGTILEIPPLAPNEVVMMSLEQLNMFGVLIITLITMGTIAGERNSGITEIILVKPIKYDQYVTAKWFSFLLLIWLALFIGLLANWYYTNLLFGDLDFAIMLQVICLYGLWFTFVLTLSILYNTLFKSPGLVLASTIITIFGMSIINMIFGHKLTMFPNQLSNHIGEFLTTGEISNDLIGTSIILIVLTLLLLYIATFIFKRKEFI